MSPSRGISEDFRNPTALVRVLIPPEGILKDYPPEGFFTFPLWSSHGINSQYYIPSRGIFHIYLPSGALMATADIPSRGIFYTSLWRFNCFSHLTLWKIIFISPLDVFFHIFPPLEVLLFIFSSKGFHDGFGNTSTVFSSYNSLRGCPTRFSSGREYLQILQSF